MRRYTRPMTVHHSIADIAIGPNDLTWVTEDPDHPGEAIIFVLHPDADDPTNGVRTEYRSRSGEITEIARSAYRLVCGAWIEA